MIEKVIAEKKSELSILKKEVDLKFDRKNSGYGLFASIDQNLLEVTLSNVINNSFEAMESKGEILITINTNENDIVIKINDNGAGIPENVLSRVFEKGFSFNKSFGTGSGLFQAKQKLPRFGAGVEISSKENEGTEVVISLKPVKGPDWFVKSVDLTEISEIVLVDDEKDMLPVWQNKYEHLDLKLRYLSSKEELESYLKENREALEQKLFLVDYEFEGLPYTGVDLIRKYSLKNRILTTNKINCSKLYNLCETLDLGILSKSLIEFVPMQTATENKYILLEDDLLLGNLQRNRLSEKNIELDVCSTTDELFKKLPANKNAVFFLDYCLEKEEINGVQIAKKLFSKGYRRLFLYSSFPDHKLKKISSKYKGLFQGLVSKTDLGELERKICSFR